MSRQCPLRELRLYFYPFNLAIPFSREKGKYKTRGPETPGIIAIETTIRGYEINAKKEKIAVVFRVRKNGRKDALPQLS